MENKKFITTLDMLFEQERQSIVEGHFDKLPAITQKKNQMLEQVPTFGFSQTVIKRLLNKATRNQDLLAAAVHGVRMVGNRFNTIRQESGKLNTYNKSGKRVLINGRRALEWRA